MKKWMVAAAALALAGPLGAQEGGDVLADLHAEAVGQAEIGALPAAHQLAAARGLFQRLLEGDGQRLADEWSKLGFELRAAGGFLFLREAPDARRGSGFYVFPIARSRRPVLVQAPHGKESDDRLTATLAQALVRSATAGAWSTVSRKQRDLARTNGTFFEALTLAFAAAHPDGYVLQVHGFSRQKRQTPAGRQVDIIVSDGTEEPSPDLERYADCLRRRLDVVAGVYPPDVQELGATTNAQGAALRDAGQGRFVHVEMSLELRQRLAENRDDASVLESCLP